ncbi:MAG: radical SAM protein [Bacillota bacterium]
MKAAFGSISRYLMLPENVLLRAEHFGGIAFDTLTGMMVELDREAMMLLSFVRQSDIMHEDDLAARFPGNGSQVRQIIERLLGIGIVVAVSPLPPDSPNSPEPVARLQPGTLSLHWFAGPHLTAPETVHWAITYRCESRCPDCYARRQGWRFTTELDTNAALRVVEVLANWRVFQLAIGGGEPLLRSDLADICGHARRQGVAVHVTTGYHKVMPNTLRGLSGSVAVLQIGIKHDRLLAAPDEETAALSETVRTGRDMGIHVGASLMLSNTAISHFERLIGLLARARFTRITLLRYKPPADVSRWREENPSAEALYKLGRQLPEIMHRYPGVAFRIDCALSFLQRHLKPADALSAGIRGCVAGERILALAPDGGVFPCSQLVHPDLRAGNILADDLDAIWSRSAVMKSYRSFRSKATFQDTRCGTCMARVHCGGCRIYAEDYFSADPGCPNSVSRKGDFNDEDY